MQRIRPCMYQDLTVNNLRRIKVENTIYFVCCPPLLHPQRTCHETGTRIAHVLCSTAITRSALCKYSRGNHPAQLRLWKQLLQVLSSSEDRFLQHPGEFVSTGGCIHQAASLSLLGLEAAVETSFYSPSCVTFGVSLSNETCSLRAFPLNSTACPFESKCGSIFTMWAAVFNMRTSVLPVNDQFVAFVQSRQVHWRRWFITEDLQSHRFTSTRLLFLNVSMWNFTAI